MQIKAGLFSDKRKEEEERACISTSYKILKLKLDIL